MNFGFSRFSIGDEDNENNLGERICFEFSFRQSKICRNREGSKIQNQEVVGKLVGLIAIFVTRQLLGLWPMRSSQRKFPGSDF